MDRKGLKRIPKDKVENIIVSIGKTYGCDDITVKFARFKSLIIKWRRTAEWIEFTLAYNVAYMPEEYLTEVIDRLFRRFVCGEYIEMSDEMQKWVDDNRYRWANA